VKCEEEKRRKKSSEERSTHSNVVGGAALKRNAIISRRPSLEGELAVTPLPSKRIVPSPWNCRSWLDVGPMRRGGGARKRGIRQRDVAGDGAIACLDGVLRGAPCCPTAGTSAFIATGPGQRGEEDRLRLREGHLPCSYESQLRSETTSSCSSASATEHVRVARSVVPGANEGD
jgi:hypothetical protein